MHWDTSVHQRPAAHEDDAHSDGRHGLEGEVRGGHNDQVWAMDASAARVAQDLNDAGRQPNPNPKSHSITSGVGLGITVGGTCALALQGFSFVGSTTTGYLT